MKPKTKRAILVIAGVKWQDIKVDEFKDFILMRVGDMLFEFALKHVFSASHAVYQLQKVRG